MGHYKPHIDIDIDIDIASLVVCRFLSRFFRCKVILEYSSTTR